jgi:N-acetylmuramoyl-L-alanine amidase
MGINIDGEAVKVTSSKDAASEKNMQDLQSIISDLMFKTKVDMSKRLAACIQNSLVQYLSSRYTYIKDNGIKNAPFHVLIGTDMPSVLIEVSYVSNPRDCERLISDKYQDDLVEAIVIGLENYIKMKDRGSAKDRGSDLHS